MRDHKGIDHPGANPARMAQRLLQWYDAHARVLPWRVPPAQSKDGTRADPYRVWLSEIMLQQTTVAAVAPYFHKFTSRWGDVTALAGAQDGDVMAAWAGLGYYARARNLLKCARQVRDEFGGHFPEEHAALLRLPGIGPYTAAAISAIAFDQSHVVVDGNVERVMARLFDLHTPLPEAKPALTALAQDLTPAQRAGDYAQAVMDLGATICTPRAPACGTCPLREPCRARDQGTAASLPQKSPRKPKPTRYGIVYLAQRADGAWLLERRPDKGLLGGMLGWPGTEWQTESGKVTGAPPCAADWQDMPGEVRHTFTHFHLILRARAARVPLDALENRGWFIENAAFRPSDLPTVMRKVYDLWCHAVTKQVRFF